MTRALPLIAALALCVVAMLVARCRAARAARSLAASCVACLAAIYVVAQLLAPHVAPELVELGDRSAVADQGWQASVPVIQLVVALLVVSFAPVATHAPRTLGVILASFAFSLALVACDDALLIALFWSAGTVVVGWEVRRLDRVCGSDCARPFFLYQGLALTALVVGTVAFALGAAGLGAIAWLLAIAIREAALPLHGWLPAIADRVPLGLLVAFLAPQPGVYAQLVVLQDITGGRLAEAFAIVAASTSVAAAGIGLVQVSARRAAVWLVISQTALIAFGLENVSVVGRAGAILAWHVMALATSGFLMTLAAIEARRGALSLVAASGCFARTPRMATAFLLLGLASVSLPLTLGFAAEDLLVQGTVQSYPVLGLAVIVATALNGIQVLRCFFALFTGTHVHSGEMDLNRREFAAMTVVLGILLFGGMAPRLFVPTPAVQNVPALRSH